MSEEEILASIEISEISELELKRKLSGLVCPRCKLSLYELVDTRWESVGESEYPKRQVETYQCPVCDIYFERRVSSEVGKTHDTKVLESTNTAQRWGSE